jgi:hypothetical protein
MGSIMVPTAKGYEIFIQIVTTLRLKYDMVAVNSRITAPNPFTISVLHAVLIVPCC